VGAGIGILVSLLAHWLSWYFWMLCHYLCFVLTGGCRGSLGETPVNPVFALAGALVFTAWSLVLLGWITAPAGALLGALCAGRVAKDH